MGDASAEPGVYASAAAAFPPAGKKAIEKVAREQPASYLKILSLLVPREHKVEHSNLLKELTDEQLEAMIEYIKTSLEAQAGGVKLGRPKIDSATERKVRQQLAKGVGILKVAKSLGIGTGTVQRISGERATSLRGA